MALPNRIELNSGADSVLNRLVCVTWLAAVTSTALHAACMPAWLLLPVAVLLLWSRPRWTSETGECRKLVLHANGQARWGEEQGVWSHPTWRSRWFTVIRFRNHRCRQTLWISARNNSRDDYRHLGIWCHFSPQAQAGTANDSH